jgi:hypothetical protein
LDLFQVLVLGILGENLMKPIKIAAALSACLLGLFILIAPVGPVPGFFIGGTATDAPETWPDTSGVDEIALGVAGTPPRVVIIWVTQYEGELYIVGRSESTWVNMIGQAAAVKMRLGKNTYSLTASIVAEDWQPMMRTYIQKYEPNYPDIVADLPTVENALGEIVVFKLSR